MSEPIAAFLTVRTLIEQLKTCDPDADVWIALTDNPDLATGAMLLVEGIEFIDNDDEMSREIGRAKMGVPYLRAPVLRVVANK